MTLAPEIKACCSCAQCGTPFEQVCSGKPQKYCSSRCRHDAVNQRKRSRTCHTKYRKCPTCGREFSYTRVESGRDRKHCSPECRNKHKAARWVIRHAAMPKCSNHECHNRATRVGAGLCESCYCRRRRTGRADWFLSTALFFTKQRKLG